MTFSPGDPAPFFEARTGGTAAFPFHTVGGRPVVLSFLGSVQVPAAAAVVRHILERHRAWFDDKQACFFGVSIDPGDEQRGLLQDQMPGIRFIRDFDAAVSRLYGAAGVSQHGRTDYRPMTLVLDPMLRVTAVIPIRDNDRHDAQLDQAIANLGTARQGYHAPVLVLPRVFEPELCAQLMALHQEGGTRASGVMRQVDGKTVEVNDAQHKKRSDIMIADPVLQMQLRDRIGRRLVPAILQAFHFRVTHLERYLVACYDAGDGGFFNAHRDNVTRGTAHRRLALTINLNADYEGGELVFGEFGTVFRAEPGAAVVFSCSLMHEVLPVRRGKRFAFLPFLHDDAAEQIRLQNQKYIEGGNAGR
jgi:predicted 2-oxoglutarate/Fe(II)-dependent dioxygenase YbiX/peroxiredoxin